MGGARSPYKVGGAPLPLLLDAYLATRQSRDPRLTDARRHGNHRHDDCCHGDQILLSKQSSKKQNAIHFEQIRACVASP